MKKEDKTKRTREKIIQAAMEEFSSNHYDSASINTICSKNNIAKGLIYHNFKNKDDLYLECVRICYQSLLEHSKQAPHTSLHIHKQLEEMLAHRQQFFKQHPYFANLFFNSILYPPQHLSEPLKEIRSSYDEHLKQTYSALLQNVQLKPSLSLEKAVQYLVVFQEMYNRCFRDLSMEQDRNTLIEIHENKISELLDILLYGIIDENILEK